MKAKHEKNHGAEMSFRSAQGLRTWDEIADELQRRHGGKRLTRTRVYQICKAAEAKISAALGSSYAKDLTKC